MIDSGWLSWFNFTKCFCGLLLDTFNNSFLFFVSILGILCVLVFHYPLRIFKISQTMSTFMVKKNNRRQKV